MLLQSLRSPAPGPRRPLHAPGAPPPARPRRSLSVPCGGARAGAAAASAAPRFGVEHLVEIVGAQHPPKQRGDAQQQRNEHLHSQALAREGPDPREQPRGGRRGDRDVVALGLRRHRVFVPRFVDRELRFWRFAAEPLGAVEHERRVPGAAVRGADREGAFVRRDEQGGCEPGQGDSHVDEARQPDLHQRACRACRAARSRRTRRSPAAPPATRAASR